jgi:hypothetical protein
MFRTPQTSRHQCKRAELHELSTPTADTENPSGAQVVPYTVHTDPSAKKIVAHRSSRHGAELTPVARATIAREKAMVRGKCNPAWSLKGLREHYGISKNTLRNTVENLADGWLESRLWRLCVSYFVASGEGGSEASARGRGEGSAGRSGEGSARLGKRRAARDSSSNVRRTAAAAELQQQQFSTPTIHASLESLGNRR